MNPYVALKYSILHQFHDIQMWTYTSNLFTTRFHRKEKLRKLVTAGVVSNKTGSHNYWMHAGSPGLKVHVVYYDIKTIVDHLKWQQSLLGLI